MANILFVLYSDFASNSAGHVTALASELSILGHKVAIAAADNLASAQQWEANRRFLVTDYHTALTTGIPFPNRRGPGIVHAWTPRETVRQFCEKLAAQYKFAQYIHLEDNEAHLTERHLHRSAAEFRAMPPAELDQFIPLNLSHPVRAPQFLASATGVTVIIDALRAAVPPGVPAQVIWPSADEKLFHPAPIDHARRAALGIPPGHTVLVYTGNVHTVNAAEVRHLYEAVAQLNRAGLPATLLRTGCDFHPFLGNDESALRQHEIALGFLESRAELAAITALADLYVQPGEPGDFNDFRFPSKLPEYFAIGRPVVLPRTNIGLFTQHREDAYVLTHVDTPAIVAAVREITTDPALYSQLAKGARHFFEQHLSWRTSAQQLSTFYSQTQPHPGSLLTRVLTRFFRPKPKPSPPAVAEPPTPPPPAPLAPVLTQYQQWLQTHEPPPPKPAHSVPITAILWSASDELRASVAKQLTSTNILTADTSEALAKAFQQPYDGLVLLLHGEGQLHPDAIAWLRYYAAANPDGDLFYADEDALTPDDTRENPFFKPDWSPDLFLAQNYLGSFLAFQPAFARQLFTPATPADAARELTRLTNRILHIPRVLFHRRNTPPATQIARPRFAIPPHSRVTIIIPSAGRLDVLRDNLSALYTLTTYRDFEVVIIDNSRTDDLANFLATEFPDARRLDSRYQPFNYSRLNNNAARECTSPFLLFLNDDTQVRTPGWLEAMLELAARDEVGAVGAKLLYPDGRIQHAGVVMGLFDNCGHAFRTLPGDRPHYFALSECIRNVSAVTAACLLTRAEVFWEVGGFDEERLPVAYNDVDLCLRIGRAGYRVLYTPYAELLHHEAYSKPAELKEAHDAERDTLQERWREWILQDPYYSPNLHRYREDFALQEPNASVPMPR